MLCDSIPITNLNTSRSTFVVISTQKSMHNPDDNNTKIIRKTR